MHSRIRKVKEEIETIKYNLEMLEYEVLRLEEIVEINFDVDNSVGE